MCVCCVFPSSFRWYGPSLSHTTKRLAGKVRGILFSYRFAFGMQICPIKWCEIRVSPCFFVSIEMKHALCSCAFAGVELCLCFYDVFQPQTKTLEVCFFLPFCWDESIPTFSLRVVSVEIGFFFSGVTDSYLYFLFSILFITFVSIWVLCGFQAVVISFFRLFALLDRFVTRISCTDITFNFFDV